MKNCIILKGVSKNPQKYILNYFKIHFAQIILCYTFAEKIIDKLKWIQELKRCSPAQ